MISFESDYNNGCHEAILKRLIETNDERATGYGLDDYCTAAKEKIRTACGKPDADVFFLVGGTQTNATVIDAMLHSYQGAIDDMGASVYSQRDSIMSQRDPLMSLVQDGNSLAYSDLANLYNLNGVGTETFQVPDLNIDSYLEQTYQSNLAALRQPDAIENYFSDAGTQQGFENLGNFVNMTTGNMGQATAISTNELIAKYNSQMTDGILGLDEMKSMYDKAFASGNMNTLYMA